MEDWVAIAISLAAAAMAGAALRLSLKQDQRAREHHDVEWRPSWIMYTLYLTNNGTASAHDVQVVVEHGEDGRVIEKFSLIEANGVCLIRVPDFAKHGKIHRAAGGKDFQEDARIRISWLTARGTPKSDIIEMTFD